MFGAVQHAGVAPKGGEGKTHLAGGAHETRPVQLDAFDCDAFERVDLFATP